jgi:hypothetical protein
MIMTSDKDFQETKLIKSGKRQISFPFDELAKWIDNTYNVKVINIYGDTIDKGKRPRINVVCEYLSDVIKFHTGFSKISNFDLIKQKTIAEKFVEILESVSHNPNTGFIDKIKRFGNHWMNAFNLLVVFSDFESIAKIDANESISEKEITNLKRKLKNKYLWAISRCFSGVTFFFYTDDQVKMFTADGTKENYTIEYFNLLKQYDQFDYFKRDSFSISFDSKENFDKNYESNWFYYYK